MLNRHLPITVLPPIRPAWDSGTRASSCISSATAGKRQTLWTRQSSARANSTGRKCAPETRQRGRRLVQRPSLSSPCSSSKRCLTCSLSLTRAVYLCLHPLGTPSHSLNHPLSLKSRLWPAHYSHSLPNPPYQTKLSLTTDPRPLRLPPVVVVTYIKHAL